MGGYRRQRLSRFLYFLSEHFGLRFPHVSAPTEEGAEERRYVMALVYLAQRFGADLGYVFNAYSAGPVSLSLTSDLFRIGPADGLYLPPSVFIRLLRELGVSRDHIFVCASYLYLRERGVPHDDVVSALSRTYGRQTVDEALNVLRGFVK